ncbi:hypothetical protein [Herbidospora mongoliensis]|uniref:hypothetical protein n=1 Tax=Herbidospora mongoliensis TaxID=688067 RepID=UPI0008365A55|nr:hypothetical protein [Herbidospora mongoliensis]
MRLKLFVGAIAAVVVLIGLVAVIGIDRYLAFIFQREDPDCVRESEVEIGRLSEIIVPILPLEGRSQVDGDSGCAPPEEEPSISVYVDGASSDELMKRFLPLEWSQVSAARVAEEAQEGSTVIAGVEKQVDGRRIETFFVKMDRHPDTMLVMAWFPADG